MPANRKEVLLSIFVTLTLVSQACASKASPTSVPTLTPPFTSTSISPTSTSTPTFIPTSVSTVTSTPPPLPTSIPLPTCPPDNSKYGFESADVFWIPQTYIDSQAVTAVAQSESGMSEFGCYSLQLAVDLVGGHANKSKGEAFVDMRYFAPPGIKAPINLEGVEITVWIYAPRASAGDRSKPNGVQVFVKDENFKNEYGTWFNISEYTDKWIPVRLTPSKIPPIDGFMDPGFDPSRIVIVGVKIGTGTNSTSTYSGMIYVDGVDW